MIALLLPLNEHCNTVNIVIVINSVDITLRYTGWPNKNGTVDTVDFSGLCSDQQLSCLQLAG